MTIENQVQDDVSKFEINAMGDPELMADSRSRAIADAKIFKISTPLIEPGCRITRNFRDGSQEHPYVACPHCGTMQILEWDNFLANLDPAKPDDAHFTCARLRRGDRGASIDRRCCAVRVARTQSERGARASVVLDLVRLLVSAERGAQIAREWLKAKGDPASRKRSGMTRSARLMKRGRRPAVGGTSRPRREESITPAARCRRAR